MLEINARYFQVAPDGAEEVVIIKTEEDLKEHSDLLARGWKYTKVVVYEMKQGCESCSG